MFGAYLESDTMLFTKQKAIDPQSGISNELLNTIKALRGCKILRSEKIAAQLNTWAKFPKQLKKMDNSIFSNLKVANIC